MNIARFNRSCARLCIPAIDPKLFMDKMSELIRLDRGWIPRTPGTSLYIRPTVIATDAFIGVRPSSTYLFYIILSPVGAYYPEGFEPVKIMVTDKYVRAAVGGVGEAKTAANYAASLLAAVTSRMSSLSGRAGSSAASKNRDGGGVSSSRAMANSMLVTRLRPLTATLR